MCAPQASGQPVPPEFQRLQLDLLRMAGGDGTPLKWRQAQLANVLLVLLAPPPAEAVAQVTEAEDCKIFKILDLCWRWRLLRRLS